MQVSVRLVVVSIAAVAAIWLAYRWWVPGDEAQIRAVLERIAHGIGSSATEGEVGRIARAAGLRNDFDFDVRVDAGPPLNRMRGRDSVIGTAARLNGAIRNLQIEFTDVTVDVDQDLADVSLTAKARFDEGSGGRGMEARELNVTFKKVEGRWVVTDVTLVPPLEPLQR